MVNANVSSPINPDKNSASNLDTYTRHQSLPGTKKYMAFNFRGRSYRLALRSLLPMVILGVTAISLILGLFATGQVQNLLPKASGPTWECNSCGCAMSDYFDSRPQCRNGGGSNNGGGNSGSGSSASCSSTKLDQSNQCNAACCGSDGECPSGQSCNIGNGACKSGKSCNPNTAGGVHSICVSGACVKQPCPGNAASCADDCGACGGTGGGNAGGSTGGGSGGATTPSNTCDGANTAKACVGNAVGSNCTGLRDGYATCQKNGTDSVGKTQCGCVISTNAQGITGDTCTQNSNCASNNCGADGKCAAASATCTTSAGILKDGETRSGACNTDGCGDVGMRPIYTCNKGVPTKVCTRSDGCYNASQDCSSLATGLMTNGQTGKQGTCGAEGCAAYEVPIYTCGNTKISHTCFINATCAAAANAASDCHKYSSNTDGSQCLAHSATCDWISATGDCVSKSTNTPKPIVCTNINNKTACDQNSSKCQWTPANNIFLPAGGTCGDIPAHGTSMGGCAYAGQSCQASSSVNGYCGANSYGGLSCNAKLGNGANCFASYQCTNNFCNSSGRCDNSPVLKGSGETCQNNFECQPNFACLGALDNPSQKTCRSAAHPYGLPMDIDAGQTCTNPNHQGCTCLSGPDTDKIIPNDQKCRDNVVTTTCASATPNNCPSATCIVVDNKCQDLSSFGINPALTKKCYSIAANHCNYIQTNEVSCPIGTQACPPDESCSDFCTAQLSPTGGKAVTGTVQVGPPAASTSTSCTDFYNQSVVSQALKRLSCVNKGNFNDQTCDCQYPSSQCYGLTQDANSKWQCTVQSAQGSTCPAGLYAPSDLGTCQTDASTRNAVFAPDQPATTQTTNQTSTTSTPATCDVGWGLRCLFSGGCVNTATGPSCKNDIPATTTTTSSTATQLQIDTQVAQRTACYQSCDSAAAGDPTIQTACHSACDKSVSQTPSTVTTPTTPTKTDFPVTPTINCFSQTPAGCLLNSNICQPAGTLCVPKSVTNPTTPTQPLPACNIFFQAGKRLACLTQGKGFDADTCDCAGIGKIACVAMTKDSSNKWQCNSALVVGNSCSAQNMFPLSDAAKCQASAETLNGSSNNPLGTLNAGATTSSPKIVTTAVTGAKIVGSTLNPQVTADLVYVDCTAANQNAHGNDQAYAGSSRTVAGTCSYLNEDHNGSTCTPDRTNTNNNIILCKVSEQNFTASQKQELINHELVHVAQINSSFATYSAQKGCTMDDAPAGSNQCTTIGLAELGAQWASHVPAPGVTSPAFDEDYKFVLSNSNGDIIKSNATTTDAMNYLVSQCPGSSTDEIFQALDGNDSAFNTLTSQCQSHGTLEQLIPERHR